MMFRESLKKTLGIIILLLSFFCFANAQFANLKGSVKDVNGLPVIGARVVQKETNNGTVTDFNGEFTLSVPKNSVIVISSIGYSDKEVLWDGSSYLSVVLHENSELLDEVVVVGYGTQKKVNLTGSVAVVDSESLHSRPLTNASQALQGVKGIYVNQVGGGNPGNDGASIRIRGIGTIGGNAKLSPLVIIDGVVSSLLDLNPNDIESISVLKDAASTAIYGSRAANGVILITTKLEKNEGTVVEYTGSAGIQTATFLPDPVDDSVQFMEMYNKAMVNQGGVPYYSDELINEFKNNPTSQLHPNTNWMKEMFGSAFMHEHSLRFSGGTQKTNYNLSLGYLDQDGVLKGLTAAKKYTANLRLATEVTNRLGIDVGFMGTRWDTDQPAVGMFTIMNRINRMVPIQPVGRMENGDWPDSWVLTPGQNSFQNPLVAREDHYGKVLSNRIIFNLAANLKITDQLQYSARGVVNYWNRLTRNFVPAIFLHNVRTGAVTRDPWSNVGHKAEESVENEQLNFTHTMSYNPSMGSGHNLSILLGQSMEEVKEYSRYAQKTGYASKSLDELGVGTKDPYTTGNSIKDVLLSFFGRIQYNYMDKYLLEINSRYDGSSRFAKGNRWGFFPSFSAGWRISEETFMDPLNWLDELKLRVSWGQIGNQEIGRFQYVNAVSFGSGYAFGGSYDGGGVAVTQYRDPKIKWETTTMTNFGLDWSVLGGTLSGEFEVFKKRTDDILRTKTIPGQVGALDGPTTNVAVVDNTGFEVSIDHGKKFGKFTYNIGAHLTKVKNEVVDLKGETIYSGSRITEKGYPIDSWYVLETDGLFTTEKELKETPRISNRVGLGDVKYVDRNKDGVINGDDRYVAGNTFPDYTYGFNIGLSYGNLSLSTIWQGVQNIDVWLTGNLIMPFNNGAGLTKEWLTDSWTPENTNARLPRITTRHQYYAENFSPSDFWLADASYLRLKNLQLSYDLSGLSFLKNTSVDKMNLFVNAENIITFTKMKYFDPEQDVFQQSIDKYPNTKTISVGVNIRFK